MGKSQAMRVEKRDIGANHAQAIGKERRESMELPLAENHDASRFGYPRHRLVKASLVEAFDEPIDIGLVLTQKALGARTAAAVASGKGRVVERHHLRPDRKRACDRDATRCDVHQFWIFHPPSPTAAVHDLGKHTRVVVR